MKEGIPILDEDDILGVRVLLPQCFHLSGRQHAGFVGLGKEPFSNDSYQQDSIKGQERLVYGFSEKFIVQGTATKKPQDFKLFLGNEENKKQLCQLMLKVWGSKGAASWLMKCETATLIMEGRAYQLISSGGSKFIGPYLGKVTFFCQAIVSCILCYFRLWSLRSMLPALTRRSLPAGWSSTHVMLSSWVYWPLDFILFSEVLMGGDKGDGGHSQRVKRR